MISSSPQSSKSNETFKKYMTKYFKPMTIKAIKVTVQFERCFRLMEHISIITWRNPINLYITEKLIKFSKSLFCFYVLISNK